MKRTISILVLFILLSGCATRLGNQYGANLGLAGAAIGGVAGNVPGAIIGGAAGTIFGGLLGDLLDQSIQSGRVAEGYYNGYRLRAVPHWRTPRCFDVEQIVIDYDGFVVDRFWKTVCR